MEYAFASHGRHHTPEEIRPLIGKGGDKLLRELAALDHESGEGRDISEERAKIFMSRYLPAIQPTPGAAAFGNRGPRATGKDLSPESE